MNRTAKLARLESIALRTAWSDEAREFTPWLASEENLSLLGETIGLQLELEAQEQEVGPFRADIVCHDASGGAWVLIENQLERTDDSHLGQLLTYAAGLKAATIIWGGEDIHRPAPRRPRLARRNHRIGVRFLRPRNRIVADR